MSVAESATAAYSRALDQARSVLFDSSSLTLAKKVAGQSDAILCEVVSGWLHDEQRARGSVELLVVLSVAEGAMMVVPSVLPDPPNDPEPLTDELVSQANRATVNGTKYQVQTFDRPSFPPREWTLFLVEVVQGAIAR